MQNQDNEDKLLLLVKEMLIEKRGSLSKFKQQENLFDFTGKNELLLQFIVLKALQPDFAYMLDLAHYILDSGYCTVDANMAKLAALTNYRLEKELDNLKSVENSINNIMSDFRFEEKVVIKNKPMSDIYNLGVKMVSKASEKELSIVMEVLTEIGIDINSLKFMKKYEEPSKPKRLGV